MLEIVNDVYFTFQEKIQEMFDSQLWNYFINFNQIFPYYYMVRSSPK